jgi:hypothetical protein
MEASQASSSQSQPSSAEEVIEVIPQTQI